MSKLNESIRHYKMSKKAEYIGWYGLLGASFLLVVASWGFSAASHQRGKSRKNYLDYLNNPIEEDNKPEENEQ